MKGRGIGDDWSPGLSKQVDGVVIHWFIERSARGQSGRGGDLD